MAFYITSDWHFSHKNICGPDGFESKTRGQFDSTDAMNDTIIRRINSRVDVNDTIYFLGDIGMIAPTKIVPLIKRIKANIVFVRGNHDNTKQVKKLRGAGYEVHDVGFRVKKDGKVYILSHYPIGLGEKRVNLRNICGHIHSNAAYDANVINIGIDSPEIEPLYLPFGEPVPLDDAIRLVEEKWEKAMKEKMTPEEWIRYGGQK